MNFKRNLFLISSILVGALTLSACEFSALTSFKRFYYIEESKDDHKTIEKDGYTKYGNYSPYVVSDTHGGEVNLGSAYDVFLNHGGANHIPSEGKQKILVIPVEFSDYKVEKLNMSQSKFIENINKVFFGIQENNAYLSVAEYFNRSSYGKFKLDGKVADKVYKFPLSVKEIKEKKISRETLANDYYEKIIEWYESNYTDIDNYRIEGLKSGKDVPIYLIYTYPSELNDNSTDFFWAYTFSDTPLSWSSFSFTYMNETEPDSHTYIHETGHLLGLCDYYPTLESEDIVPDPAGRIDMMDCSIGDETSFSKMFLNWTRPFHVTDSCEITVNSFTNSGDVILLADSWNKTVFDEYYLIEYYTPTGLNTYDVSFGNSQAKLPTVPGIKVYHVDSRLAYVRQGLTKTIIGYCTNGGESPSENNIDFAHDNNTYKNPNSYQEKYLYTLILNNAKSMVNGCVTNANLFRTGEEIKYLKFHDGSSLNYKISINSIDFKKASLKIEKIAEIVE